jgi:reactive intermediate/imine deaminase
MDKTQVNPWTWQDAFGFSQAWRVDDAQSIVFVSGQGPISPQGELVGEGDFEAQTRQVFENLSRALEAADAAWSDVVKLDYFLRDVSKIASVRTIRDEYVDTEHPPASTLLEVSGLFRPDVLIEIQAIAIKT